jgi:hypothetical protein
MSGLATNNVVRIALKNMTASSGLGFASAGTAFIQDSTGFWQPVDGSASAPSANGVYYRYDNSAAMLVGVSSRSSYVSNVWISEITDDDAFIVKHLVAVYNSGYGSFGEFTENKLAYTSSDPRSVTVSPSYSAGFVSDRGVKLLTMGTTSMSLQYPKTVVKAKYTIKAS